jgi:hypothetical protein
VCADVGPRGREVELVRVSARQGPVRPPRGEPRVGERCRRDEVGVRPAMMRELVGGVDMMTLVQGLHMLLRQRLVECLEDFRRRLEVVLQGVPEGMWTQIQDEGVLEQCVGLRWSCRP